MAVRIVVFYLFLINIMAFVLYGMDKRRAVKGLWRISETALIGSAVVGGCVGALLGMMAWHHKTRKCKFRILVPLLLVLWTAGVWFVLRDRG